MNKFLLPIIAFGMFMINAGNLAAQAPLNGSYTINSGLPTGGTNFISFGAFADTIHLNGISGNVVATVTSGSGPYHEQVVFETIPGSDSVSVMLEGSGETLFGLTDSSNRHTIRLWDIKNFTINNLRIVRDTASTHAFYGIHIYNSGENISITNCHVDMSGTSSTLIGAYIASGSVSSILAAGDFHNINISHDTAVGGGYGASVFGLSASVLATHIVISDNVFYDFHSNGVYIRETDSVVISGNQFDKRTPNVTSDNAIQIAQAANINANIYNNFIKMSQVLNGTMTFRGIYLFNGTGHKVYNNVIYDINLTSGNFSAIVVRTAGTAPEIYFNTISIDNPNAGSGDLFGIEEDLSNTNSILRNNLISISQPTTGTKAALALGAIATITTAFNSNNNNLWLPNGNIAVVNSLTPVLYPTMSDWKTASGQDVSSFNLDPGFQSLTVPIPTSIASDNGGVTIPWISTDVLGITRSSPPDIGAYEYLVDGVKELKNENLIAYPNPNFGELRINVPELSSHVVISIYNEYGSLVAMEESEGKNGGVISVRTTTLVPGLYVVNLVSGNKNFRAKFVKQ